MNQYIDSIVLIVDSGGKVGPLLSLNTSNPKPWNSIFPIFDLVLFTWPLKLSSITRASLPFLVVYRRDRQVNGKHYGFSGYSIVSVTYNEDKSSSFLSLPYCIPSYAPLPIHYRMPLYCCRYPYSYTNSMTDIVSLFVLWKDHGLLSSFVLHFSPWIFPR